MTVRRKDAAKALVLMSGGQDSAVCLAWALSRYSHTETLGFSYGQRHSAELTCRPHLLKALASAFPHWGERLGPDHLLDLSVLSSVSDTALTSEAEIALDANGLPNTFVPARNLLFFTLAAALAYRRGIRDLIGGMCQTDYSGYPDCRNETLATLNHAINLGTAERFSIVTPLMWRTKAETWALADALGGAALTSIVIEHTHTCYLGDREHRHEWGYGCGTCPACKLREKGYREWQDVGALHVHS
jgi:7-cyano-7-deazaguanine synthase